jgi:hypothetical protein
MKRIFILPALVFTIVAARADLVIEQSVVGPQSTRNGIIKIKGDKIRADMVDGTLSDRSQIIDLNTGDEFTLLHNKKEVVKTSLMKFRQTSYYSNAIAANTKLPKPLNTGKTEKVNGYDTEIYTWTNSRGMTETLWVAKNFPNFGKIKNDLAKLDKLNDAELDKMAPDQSALSGMLIKMQWAGIGPKESGLTLTTTLISAKVEPIDASIFEVPKDYHEVKSP